MSGVGYELIMFLAIALIIVAVCILPGFVKKSSKEINGSKKGHG